MCNLYSITTNHEAIIALTPAQCTMSYWADYPFPKDSPFKFSPIIISPNHRYLGPRESTNRDFPPKVGDNDAKENSHSRQCLGNYCLNRASGGRCL